MTINLANGMGGSAGKRQFYYTLANEIDLDPEIANDLLLYAQ